MYRAVKPFKLHIDGRPVSFPVGREVPIEMVEDFDLFGRGLVDLFYEDT